jgi:hypothetical protein
LQDETTFAQIYKYSFSFSNGGGKLLDIDLAEELLLLLLGPECPHTAKFCVFLQSVKPFFSPFFSILSILIIFLFSANKLQIHQFRSMVRTFGIYKVNWREF